MTASTDPIVTATVAEVAALWRCADEALAHGPEAPSGSMFTDRAHRHAAALEQQAPGLCARVGAIVLASEARIHAEDVLGTDVDATDGHQARTMVISGLVQRLFRPGDPS